MWIEVIIFVTFLVTWWTLKDKKAHAGFPPGPRRFPIIGNLPQLLTKSPNPAVAFAELAKSYGDVMFINIGALDTVIISSHDKIQEIFHHEKASMRAGFKIPVVKDRIMAKNIGLLWSNGDVWTTIRRFTLKTLRDFGFGKTLSMDFVINEELEKFATHIDKLCKANADSIVDFDGLFDMTVINVLWRLVTGINFGYESTRMTHLLKISNDQVKSTSFAFDISIAFPVLRDWFPLLFGRKEQMRIINDLHNFGRETIAEHRALGHYLVDPRGFVDVFLAKINEEKDDPHSHFNDDQLLLTVLDLFQDIQEKVHEEISSIVTQNEPIVIALKTELPYTYATLLETLRYSTVVPFPPMRQASDNFYFHGHFIPKGTALMPNAYATHFDPAVWKDPNNFRPERFLTAKGNVDSIKESFLIPFGGGKRSCVGKNLAEANLFMYFATLIRNYKFMKVPNQPEPSVVPIPGMTNAPQPFTARVLQRNAARI